MEKVGVSHGLKYTSCPGNESRFRMNILELTAKASFLRLEAFEMAIRVGKGHLGGSFSCTEMLVALYYGGVLKYDPKDVQWKERDRFILSKGHAVNTFQVLLADLGFFPKSELLNFLQDGSFLGGHVDSMCPGMELIGGSLGHGLGVGAGMSLGLRMNKSTANVYVLLGDGECQEGSIWEAAMFAGHHKLNGLTALLDRNTLASEGFTEDILSLEPLADKWQAFGWNTITVDGHDINQILSALRAPKTERPKLIICRTVKGKGMSWCENTARSHHTMPNEEQIKLTRKELSNV